MMYPQRFLPLRPRGCKSDRPQSDQFEKVGETPTVATHLKNDGQRSTHHAANETDVPCVRLPVDGSTLCPAESALSRPTGHSNQGATRPSLNAVSNEGLFLRKISKMISEEQWVEMDDLLTSPTEFAAFVDDASISMKNLSLNTEGCSVSPMEVIHYACRFNPPRTIIRHLASLYPDGVTCPDNMGRLPLHHAVKWGASYRLICFLVEKDRSAASVKDSSGKTPLHLLCENYAQAYDPRNCAEISVEESMLGAIRILVDAAPEAVNIEDNNGVTPVEHAIESDSPFKAVRFIQKSSERNWKTLKKSMPSDKTHVHIEEKLKADQQEKQKKLEMREMQRLSSRKLVQQRSAPKLNSSVQAQNDAKLDSQSIYRRSLPPRMQRQPETRSAFARSA